MDRSRFPVGREIDYKGAQEIAALEALRGEAAAFLANDGAPPVAELSLAFGVAPIMALFLARFELFDRPEDAERWVVVGDLPAMHFETDDAPTPALGLQLYCAIAQDWADTVLARADLSECYPIEVEPTAANAEMLLSRVDFIRRQLVPLAEPDAEDEPPENI